MPGSPSMASQPAAPPASSSSARPTSSSSGARPTIVAVVGAGLDVVVASVHPGLQQATDFFWPGDRQRVAFLGSFRLTMV
jgi:hypothetical protein